MLCKCPHLTPLQSRLAASVLSLVLVAIVFWSLSNPHFAYASELGDDGAGNSRPGEDHNWHRIEDERLIADGVETVLEEDLTGNKKRYKAYKQWLRGKSLFKQRLVVGGEVV